jgi:NET1-associated nuclear protein 1 (U3 small nucleolar RNA-associated protein 17)
MLLGKITTEDNTHLYRVSLSPTPETAGLPVQESSETIGIGKLRTPNGLAVSPSGSWVVVISGHKAHVASTTNPRAGFKKFTAPEHLTCLTFHPTDDCFATGDTKGIIRLWYCLTDGSLSEASGLEKRAQTTSFHWHAHAVSSLAYTPNGAYLLSGGEEAVLVIWQLHTNKKEFVPRVGAPISTIAVSPAGEEEEEYLLGLSDSTYAFISSGSLKISRTFSQLKLGEEEGKR